MQHFTNRPALLLLLATAMTGSIAAGTIPIGLSTSPVVFSPAGGSDGTIAIGGCVAADCAVNGAYNKSGLAFSWGLNTSGTLAYSGGPGLYGLAGNTSSFTLSDAQSDNLSGTVTWNHAAEGSLTTDLNGTLTLQSAQFASLSDPLALAAFAYFGGIPVSGQAGSIDLIVDCSGPCIMPADPTGQIVTTTLTFSSGGTGSTVPEPGTLILPGLALGGFLMRKRLAAR